MKLYLKNAGLKISGSASKLIVDTTAPNGDTITPTIIQEKIKTDCKTLTCAFIFILLSMLAFVYRNYKCRVDISKRLQRF